MKGVLVGAGYFAQFHADGWQRLEGVTIAGVADPDVEKARAFALRWNLPAVYSSVEGALAAEKPDFIDVVTRPNTHLACTRAGAQHGVHVICQKPMAPSLDECRAMVDECRTAGVRLLIHENWRWQPWYRAMRTVIDSGRLGRLLSLGVRMRTGDGRGDEPYAVQPYFREMPRLLIYETLVHYLDTFRFLGGEVESIFCRTKRVNPVIAGEDWAMIHARFRNGADGLIDANRIAGKTLPEVAFGEFRVEGTEAAIRMNARGEVWIAAHGGEETPLAFDSPTTGYKGDSVLATQRQFVECLRGGRSAQSEGESYLKTVELVEACYQSAESGAVVEVA